MKTKKIIDHPQVKEYKNRMKKEERCTQCVSPHYDGLCECGQFGDEQKRMACLILELLKIGWKD